MLVLPPDASMLSSSTNAQSEQEDATHIDTMLFRRRVARKASYPRSSASAEGHAKSWILVSSDRRWG